MWLLPFNVGIQPTVAQLNTCSYYTFHLPRLTLAIILPSVQPSLDSLCYLVFSDLSHAQDLYRPISPRAMSGQPAQALATHLINQTLSSLSVLETLDVLSREDAALIRSKLPNPYGPFPSLQPSLNPQITTSFGQLSVGPASPPPPHISPQHTIQSPSPNPQSAMVPSLPARAPLRESRARALWDYNGTVRHDQGSSCSR